MVVTGFVLSALTAACEPESFMREVEYVNKTDTEIAVYKESMKQFELPPGGVGKWETIVGLVALSFEARDKTGRVIFQLKTTPKELEKAGWRIVITDQTLAPTPGPPIKPP